MPRRLAAALLVASLALALAACGGDEVAPAPPPAAPAGAQDVLAGTAPTLEGGTLDLATLDGSVVLVVNTASRCGYTPQMTGLEQLWQDYRARGLVVLGQPSDSFRQEAPTDAEVEQVCRVRYGVTFPLLGRGPVTGADATPLFRALAATPGDVGAPPAWNFTKYLVDRDGRPVARFDSAVEPDDPELVGAIEGLLAQPADGGPAAAAQAR